MEAKSNDETEISQKVSFGELSALLNEITSNDSDVKKSDTIKKKELSRDLFKSEGTSGTEKELKNIDSELISLKETIEKDSETNKSLKEYDKGNLKEEASPETCHETEPDSIEVSENLADEPKESEETMEKETEKFLEPPDSMKEPATLESESLIEPSETLLGVTKNIKEAEEVTEKIEGNLNKTLKIY